MPRAAGESDKLGNRYEGVWTVDSLLDVLSGEADSLVVESFGEEARGVEFRKMLPDGSSEFHSAKRQSTGNVWSFADLSRGGVLAAMATHLRRDPHAVAVFVSGTTANALNELTERAGRSQSIAAFEEHLTTTPAIRSDFEHHWLPFFPGDRQAAFEALKRFRVDGGPEHRLIRVVEQRIRLTFYRADGGALDATELRLLLGEMLSRWFGQPITAQAIRDWIAQHGYAERDWARDRRSSERIEALVTQYLRHVEAELIAGGQIERSEAKEAFDVLHSGEKHRVVLLGNAGLGKSCVAAQVVHLFHSAGVPCLPVRLDVQSQALTAKQLGEHFDLRESPVVVLAGLANGREAVLVLDQLDALSFASGRNQRLWDAFEQLLFESRQYPNMRILLTCREFDAQHDQRLRGILAEDERTLTMRLQPLELEKVRRIIAEAGVDPTTLPPRALQILQTPLHLSLYLQGDPRDHPPFASVQDLLGRYWEHKRREASGVRWYEIINRLSGWLSTEQTLSAPVFVLDEFATDADRLCTLHVLVRDGAQYRFFHESFFDYCWARIFVTEGRRLLELLTGSEQHLFRRAQVRQVLVYERGTTAFDRYLRDLGDVLLENRIRFHLKRLALDWLRTLDEPHSDEWELLQRIPSSSALGQLVPRMPHRSVPWFDLLLVLGQWDRWLDSADPDETANAIFMLSMDQVMQARSRQVAALLAPTEARPRPWKPIFSRVFRFGEVHHSPEMFDLFIWAIRAGHLHDADPHLWHSFTEMAKARPDLAIELIGTLLETGLNCAAQGEGPPLDHFPAEFCSTVASHEPATFVRRVVAVVARGLTSDEAGGFHRSWRTNWRLHDFESAFHAAFEDALVQLAREQPALLLDLMKPLEELREEDAASIVLSAWAENGTYFCDRGVDYLLGDPDRLNVGYASWSAGNGRAAITRAAVGAFSPHCSDDHYRLLEAAILQFSTPYERKDPKGSGYIALLLLHCLPASRISAVARQRYRELSDKFPWEKFEKPSVGGEVIEVGPPIPKEKITHITDDGWIGAMRKYTSERNGSASDFSRGGIHQLASELRAVAQAERTRFAKLALRMPDDLSAEYFDAILSGIATEPKETGNPEASDALDVPTIESVIVRVHALPGKPCAKTICHAIKVLADRSASEDLVAIVAHYATADPDPEKETWREESGGYKSWGGLPHSQGINTARGCAAEAIAALLFAGRAFASPLEGAALSVIHDRSVAVRSCAVDIVIAMLRFDRARAVQLFLELCDGADEVLSSPGVDRFLHYACFDHYRELRPLMQRMLTMEMKEARASAARQIAVASFNESLAHDDLNGALAQDAMCRQAVAGVFAHNLGQARVADRCREFLPALFDDEAKEVRAAAADCFGNLSVDQVPLEETLMRRFINSAACGENAHELIAPLENAVTVLPDIVCLLPERLIEEQLADKRLKPIESRYWTHRLPSLITRLYGQTLNNAVKTRCLDIIDAMLELGFSEIDDALDKVER